MIDDDLDKSPEKSASWQGFQFFCGNSSGELNRNSRVPNFLESDDIITLSEARAGEIVLIVELLLIDCVKYLQNMGLSPGIEIQVISRTTTGSVIVLLSNQQIGLGKNMAINILVKKSTNA
ncbi:MAG: ferrous iron transport protein A, partial [Cyanobacteriota bacterium]|nr:ferrous iron transport protein A [Cyanobacteriota bacterium]